MNSKTMSNFYKKDINQSQNELHEVAILKPETSFTQEESICLNDDSSEHEDDEFLVSMTKEQNESIIIQT
jgi:hypothetical protein